MQFNSWEFIVFFPTVALLYYVLPYRLRILLLLLSSYFFYMSWRAEYIVLILMSTLVDYLAGIGIDRSKSRGFHRLFLGFSLLCNLGLLFSFKYFNFFNGLLGESLASFSLSNPLPRLDVLLPVGISFYTFQTLSYTIEVYWGRQKAEYNPARFALYVAFFPQLVAGPIERPQNLLGQFRQNNDFDPVRATEGLRLILWGMFKKVVIADNLAMFVDAVYSNPDQSTGLLPVLATIFFAFQIYCDFSGYSDIAIGTARFLGYDLMTNFRCPYKARSIDDFWKRWHISLSTWFRDYVYIPLGGNRARAGRWTINIMATFLISGLWHGANTTFVVWGGLHGLYYLVGRATSSRRKRISQALGLDAHPVLLTGLQMTTTFVLVVFAWVFFRANNLGDALVLIVNMFTGWDTLLHEGSLHRIFASLGFPVWHVGLLLLGILFVLEIEALDKDGDINAIAVRLPKFARWTFYLALALATLNLGTVEDVPFIYFQF